MLKYCFNALMAAALASSLSAFAQDSDSSAKDQSTAEKSPEQVITETLDSITGGAPLGAIRPSVIDGLYNVQIIGGPAIMITGDGKHVVMGDTYDVTSEGLVPVQDPYLLKARREFVESIGEGESINFPPEDGTEHVAYVFTDVDCGYCRRMHSRLHSYRERGEKKPGYNDLGIEIRYLAYPRAGANSPSAAKLESAWCAADPSAALDSLKNLEQVEAATCENAPIEKHYRKGGELGVTGTPAVLFPDGRLVVGFLPPERMLQTIEQGQ